MPAAKNESFDVRDQKVALLAKALSHPARIAILRILAKRGTCICGEIVSELPLAQSTVSQHLKDLKEVGIIQGEVEGPKSCYCINWKNLGDVWRHLQAVFGALEKGNPKNCC